MEEQSIDILERIHASYYQLTAAERKVADYVLTRHERVQFMSITQLAEECGIAEATISRFCRSLDLKGFNTFKLELARHSVGAVPKPVEQSGDSVTAHSRQVGRLAVEAVQQTVELVDPRQVRKAVQFIEQATRVICMGTGGSMIMANECAHMFSLANGKFSALADAYLQMSRVATMDREDVIILFSYSGATDNGLKILKLARSRGIRTVLITRFSKSPAAKLADVVLCCGSNEGPFQGGSVPARIAQLVVVDILFREYCHRNREQCDENLHHIAAALSGMHL